VETKLIICSLEEIETLVQLSVKTFSDAFEKHNSPDDFAMYLKSAFSMDRLEGELKNPDSTFFFIYTNDDIVGYLKINKGEAQTELNDENAWELERIYILQAFQGKQLGSWALNRVLKLAKEASAKYVWLGVWESNLRAIKFYESHGFKKFGEHPYYVGADKQNDWLMRL
jgi:ribosomal protein S18 acetylase RimI-like enzyme